MSNEDEKVIGEQGFKGNPVQKDIITKEETMFKVGSDGIVIPEKCPIFIYDFNIDKELIEETNFLMLSLNKQKGIKKIIENVKAKEKRELDILKMKIDGEKDENKEKVMQTELDKRMDINSLEKFKEMMNDETIEQGIKESRKLIKELNELKEKTTITKYIEIMPCKLGESHYVFEQQKTVEGKDTDDWVADLISKRCHNPKYNLEEAKNIKSDHKNAIKEALMTASGFKNISYRDIMSQKWLEENRPLTLKKEKPIGETTTPAESVS